MSFFLLYKEYAQMNRLLLLVFSGFSTFLFFSYGNEYFKPERCKAEISFVKDADRLSIATFHSFFSGVGTVSVSGVLYNRNKAVGYISKTIRFSYKKTDNTYIVTSEVISRSPQMTLNQDQEKKWFPSFFYEVGKSLVWTIRPVSKNASLIFSETSPIYVCEKTS